MPSLEVVPDVNVLLLSTGLGQVQLAVAQLESTGDDRGLSSSLGAGQGRRVQGVRDPGGAAGWLQGGEKGDGQEDDGGGAGDAQPERATSTSKTPVRIWPALLTCTQMR